MTYIIGMVSRKGGAGKSTLARLFGRELAQDDFSVKIADLDPQQSSCTEWATDWAEAGILPEIQVQPFENLRTALVEADRSDAYILDGRPHSSKLAHNLVDSGIETSRIPFALAKTTRNSAEISAARAYLEQTEYAPLDGFLPGSTTYGIAHDAGKTVAETSYQSLNENATYLAQAIIDCLANVTTRKENL